MRGCGNDLVALAFQRIEAIGNIVKFMNVNPFLGTHRNFLVDAFAIALFDHVQLLNTKNLATAHHRTSIVHLENIFNSNGKMFGSVFQYFQELVFAVFGQDIFEKMKVVEVNHIAELFLQK